ncbi:Transcriptional factor B3 family protein / auxin-responsive factor AUX/IAA-related isoform 4 [Hibiscus syriacus]|uniref:Auxin response factor n=1 Tax=Hibiscus syriacus TaxID=106335 RepID=A0A6A3BWK3_HIBSY|nr:Transcriptional factor B3 family protein / auxin-responsive factor AUX/IAA-related isoform 4 [Hibiscus syriacus]
MEWRFRHIFRGQPRRHLLTSGWSAFVNKKKLVPGDAVLFLRFEIALSWESDKNGTSFPSLCSKQLNHNTFADVVHAVSKKSVFSIYYNPRYVTVYTIKICDKQYSEDAIRINTGLIMGIGDLDPVRWPSSKWRCLLVRWDDIDANRHGRVSPWEIEPSDSIYSSNNLLSPGLKRNRVGLPSGESELIVPGRFFCIAKSLSHVMQLYLIWSFILLTDGIGASDFTEPLRFQRVLQGQEISGFDPFYNVAGSRNMHRSEIRHSFPCSNGFDTAAIGNVGREPLVNPDISYKGVGFEEYFRFHKVLQGQELFVSSPYGKASTAEETRGNESLGVVRNGGRLLWSRSGWSSSMQGYNTHSPIQPSAAFAQVSSPCENSCRLFGFSLTKGSLDGTKEGNMVQATLSSSSGSFLPRIGETFNQKPAVAGNLKMAIQLLCDCFELIPMLIVVGIVLTENSEALSQEVRYISMKQPRMQLTSSRKVPMVAKGCMFSSFKTENL